MAELTAFDKTRYHRQMLVEGWDDAGQRKLKAASVFIAGAGGLGSPVSIYLAVAGVGEIRICDSDKACLGKNLDSMPAIVGTWRGSATRI